MPLLIIKLFFAACWIVAGFALFRWAAGRFFRESGRAATLSASVVLAILAGMALPFSGVRSGSPATASAVDQALFAAPHDVATICRRAHFSGATKPLGNIDAIGDLQDGRPAARANGFVADRAGRVWLGGWAADLPGKDSARAACLVIDGKLDPRAWAEYGIARSDVVSAYKVDAFVSTGFSLMLPVSDLRSGVHHVSAAVVLASGETDALPSSWTVSVP